MGEKWIFLTRKGNSYCLTLEKNHGIELLLLPFPAVEMPALLMLLLPPLMLLAPRLMSAVSDAVGRRDEHILGGFELSKLFE